MMTVPSTGGKCVRNDTLNGVPVTTVDVTPVTGPLC
jgi:hypothetical protein